MALALYRIAVQPKSPLEADLFTLNIALRFASYCSDLKLMNEIISAAGPLGLVPDIVTYTTLVQGLLRAGRPELARQTLDSMKSRGMEPNERMAAMLVADLAANGRADGLTRAEDVIRDMRTRGIRTTVPMWTSLIAGYFRGGWQVDAWAALDRMRASGLRLNDIGYNVVLRHVLTADAGPAPTTTSTRARRALGHQMSADKSTASLAMKVFHHMKDNSVPPTADTYTILLGGLLRSDSVGDIRDVLNDIDVRGFKTHNRSLSEMIRTARKSLTRSARMRGDRL
jgi:pentatricopeptide repeat protein